MATTFPPNPSFEQEVDTGSKVFVWNGDKWVVSGVGGSGGSDLNFDAILPIRVDVLNENINHDFNMSNLTEVTT